MPYFNNHQYASGKKVSACVHLIVWFVACLFALNRSIPAPTLLANAAARFMMEQGVYSKGLGLGLGLLL